MAVKKSLLLLLGAALLLGGALPAAAGAPYESYLYNYWGDAVPAPDAYLPDKAVTGGDLGIGSFAEPSDAAVSPAGEVYILDSGNKRIVVLDREYRLRRVLESFDNNGTKDGFQGPSGIYVDGEGLVYVADTAGKRIVVLNAEGRLQRIVDNPQSDILASGFQFLPLKVTADRAGRIYTVAQGVFEGLMQFDEQGRFIGYIGTNKVRRDYREYIWRLFSTDAQRAQGVLFVPTEFSNADADYKGFLYATNIDQNSTVPIKRLNPSGEDVLKRFGYNDVRGDLIYRTSVGPSKMIDIKFIGDGMYSALDATQNRVFTYDDEGHLLYVFGGKGNQLGTLKTPVAVEKLGGDRLVLDRGRASLVVYKPTFYGAAINEAAALHYRGEDAEALGLWRKVLQLNSNFDLAYIGIGKAYLMEKNNKAALDYFKLGSDKKSYSVAYKRYRREMMKEHFGTVLTAAASAAALLAALKLAATWRGRRGRDREANLH